MLDADRHASLTFAKPLQHEGELAGLLALLTERRVRSYLEIGARYGGSFEQVMMTLPVGSTGLCVDFPGGNFGDDGSTAILLEALKRVRRSGRDANCIFGPSAAPEVVERVKRLAPFDAVLIDGDHRYEAVKRDFELYAPLARIVILHDIAAPSHVASRTGVPVEVPRLWAEVKDNYPSIEITDPGTLMGIGVLFRDQPGA